jgi:hydrogenase/urease accessory protein HupE
MKIPVFLLLTAFAASGHEIGTTRVSAAFSAGKYEIEVVTDAAALSEKLEAVSGMPGKQDGIFRQRAKVAFDGVETRPEIVFGLAPSTDPSAPIATIRLTGEIPTGAREFVWSYGWTFATYSLSVRSATAGQPVVQWLEGGQASSPILVSAPLPAGRRLEIAWRYLRLGYTHILPHGLDHMLFVLGIYLLSGRARHVLMQVSAFTLAHSITLALSVYGLVSISPRVVEPLIAISIAYVAVENIFLSELKSWRVALVFAFGLLHGLGFAGALHEVGLPRSEYLTALLTFNLGVEAGQLSVIGAAFLLIGWYGSRRPWYRSRFVVPASALIACTAVYWTIQRLL